MSRPDKHAARFGSHFYPPTHRGLGLDWGSIPGWVHFDDLPGATDDQRLAAALKLFTPKEAR